MATAPTAPPFMEPPQPPSYDETMGAPPPPHYHMGPPPPQGYTSGPPPPQGYGKMPQCPYPPQGNSPYPPQGNTSGPPPPQGYSSGPPPPQGYSSGPPPPHGYAKVPQCPYPPQPVGPPVTSPVVSVQTIYVQPGLGARSVQVHCPACAQIVMSRTEYHTGTLTWLSCLALSFFGCIYGCCLIPFCADGLKDVKHFCPNCNNVLGEYRRL